MYHRDMNRWILAESGQSAGLRIHLRLSSLALATIGLVTSLLSRRLPNPDMEKTSGRVRGSCRRMHFLLTPHPRKATYAGLHACKPHLKLA